MSHFTKQANHAITDQHLRQRTGIITDRFLSHSQTAINDTPQWEKWRSLGEEIKSHSIKNLDLYLEKFEAQVVAGGGQVHWAMDATMAQKIIATICQQHQARLVVKSKSMVGEEINLNHFLASQHIKVVETDLGDYIVQLKGDAAFHPIAPALHIDKTQVAQLFYHHHRHLSSHRPLDTIPALMNEAKGEMRKNFLTATVGITGANFLVAESGSVVVITNEGNGDLTACLPPVHIVLATIDKVVPTLFDAMHLTRLACRAATGQKITSYASIFTGTNRWQDGDGGQSFHVILLDNKRTNLLTPQLRSSLHCIKCGACLNHCPIYQNIGGHAYGGVHKGPIGAVVAPTLQGFAKHHELPFASSLCGRCDHACPTKVPLKNLLIHQRSQAFARGFVSKEKLSWLKALQTAARHPKKFHRAVQHIRTNLRRDSKTTMIKKSSRFAILLPWFRKKNLPTPSAKSFFDGKK